MNDPHVVALKYSIEHDGTVKYDDAQPITCERPEFSINIADRQVHIEFNTHFATEDAALKAVDLYIRSWELGAALIGRPGQFNLRFQSSTIVDRDPPPRISGRHRIGANFRFGSSSMCVAVSKVSPRPYPPPPSEITLDPNDPNVLTMYSRFKGYLDKRETLAGMAYFCLTMLESHLCNNRKCAARTHAISLKVLRKIGELCTERGGRSSARKATGIDKELTSQERLFLVEAVKAIIRRAAEVALDPKPARPKITMSDLPELLR